MEDKNKLKVLHEAVSQDYDIGTFEEFSTKLSDPTRRKAFYDGVGSEYKLGTFEEFDSKISTSLNGGAKKKSSNLRRNYGATLFRIGEWFIREGNRYI